MDSVLGELPGLVREQPGTQMATTMDYRSAFARRFHAEGKAESILLVSPDHGLTVPDEAASRILSCHDLHTLSTWLERAATVATVDALLG